MARGPIPDKPSQRPTVPDVIAKVEAYYRKPGNSCGGILHCTLDDHNYEEHFLRGDVDRAIEHQDDDALHIATALLAMTPTQRRKVCQTHRGSYA